MFSYVHPDRIISNAINPMSRGVFFSSSYAGGGLFGPHRKPTSPLNFSTKFGMYIGLRINCKFQFKNSH